MQSIGERLEEARKRKGISIREAAEATKIRGEYLHKFESNQYDIKLPEIYVRGFLRTYSNYLKLPGDKIIADYNALGLNDSKQRNLSREIYGRMDLSVSSAKTDKTGKEPGTEGSSGDSAAIANDATRNPATFVPPTSGNNISIDKKLLIKAGALVAITIVVVLLAVWAFSGSGGKNTNSASNSNGSMPAETWIKPLVNERSLALVAVGRVTVTATQSDGTIFYQGTIPAGESRAIPRRGKTIDVRTDTPANLKFRIDGTLHDPFGPGSLIDAPAATPATAPARR